MGVYIDMEMPKNCFDCKLCYDAFYCKVLEIGFYDDRDKEYRQEGFDPETARLQGCPLVPVPAHGDLVDLSSPFVAQYYDEMKEEWMEKPVTVRDVLYDCMVYGMPPTVIPAEEEP